MSFLMLVILLWWVWIMWLRIGSRKVLVLFELVLVVMRVGCGCFSVELRWVKVLVWCLYGVKFLGIYLSLLVEYFGVGVKGIWVCR